MSPTTWRTRRDRGRPPRNEPAGRDRSRGSRGGAGPRRGASSPARGLFQTTPRRGRSRRRSGSFSTWGGTAAAAARPWSSPSRSRPRSTCGRCSRHRARGRGDHAVPRRQRSRPRAAGARALATEEGAPFPPGSRPSREVAVRLALVHEFRTRSKVLVCTEAGAKGLNLQFCETVINYDLPWNPQRIEQRIGRCHRYSQQRDVTVVNFIARDNEAQQLTFEILSQKLDLFGKVLDASDTCCTSRGRTLRRLWYRRCRSNSRATFGASTAARARLTRSRARSLLCATRLKRGGKPTRRSTSGPRRSSSRGSIENVRQGVQTSARGTARRPRAARSGSRRSRGWLPRPRPGRVPASERGGRVVFEVDDGLHLGVDVGDGRRFATGDARGVDRRRAVEPRPSAGRRCDRARPNVAGRRSVALRAASRTPSPELAALAGKPACSGGAG